MQTISNWHFGCIYPLAYDDMQKPQAGLMSCLEPFCSQCKLSN